VTEIAVLMLVDNRAYFAGSGPHRKRERPGEGPALALEARRGIADLRMPI